MTIHLRRSAGRLWSAAALLALAACGSDGGTTPSPSGAAVSAVRVNPPSSELGLGSTLQLKLIALDAQDNEVPGSSVVWVSADTSIATVSQAGLVTGRKLGVVQLQAASDGRSAFSVISVVAPRVAAVAVTPTAPSVQAGGAVRLAARLTDGDGAVLTERLVFWQSSNDGVARVTSTGLVNGVTAGTATITASSEGKSATVQVTVTAASSGGGTTPPPATPPPTTPPPSNPAPPAPGTPAPPAPTTTRVDVTPTSASLVTGRTQQLTATARDASGAVRPDRVFTWSSSAPAVATVDASGLVTAVGPGSATITARADGVSGSASITVTAPAPAPVSRVEVSPATLRIYEDRDDGPTEAVLTASLFDAGDNPLTGRSCTWSGGKRADGKGSALVTIEPLTPTTARVRARDAGTTAVTATCEGRSASSAITVVDG